MGSSAKSSIDRRAAVHSSRRRGGQQLHRQHINSLQSDSGSSLDAGQQCAADVEFGDADDVGDTGEFDSTIESDSGSDVERREFSVLHGRSGTREESGPVVILTTSEPLTDKNFMLYCARHYNNPACVDQAEFLDDLKRIKYVKKCISRYVSTGDLKERLILNHLIVLYNVFGAEHLPRILFLKMREQLMFIRPFMELLSIWPDHVFNVGKDDVVDLTEVKPDQSIIKRLDDMIKESR